ncbi:caffeine dehydrogenase subunit gamma [Abditibacteriota bacterium]|nr:caffeine dehydrogenase subunit gamma [Abditibacteriota bacterium]
MKRFAGLMRDHIFFFLNGQKIQVRGREALGMLAPFLRRERGLTGTKIACAHGACGSCSILLGRPTQSGFNYQPINSCIFPVFACDGAHVITVEGLNGPDKVGGQDDGVLSPVQCAMVDCHGAQCGFCTPGIVITLTAFHENRVQSSAEDVKAALEGNLCRCTGYSPIIEAGMSVETADLRPLTQIYPPEPLLDGLNAGASDAVEIRVPEDELEIGQHLFVPRSPEEAICWKVAHPEAIVVSGGTEVGVAMSVKGLAPREILSLAHLEDWDEVTRENDELVLGARATWTQVAEQVGAIVPEFATLLTRWGSPQLRNAGTVAGNIIRAAPISDSLPFLLACEAELEFIGELGARRVTVADFLESGPTMRPDELLRRVLVPLPKEGQTLRLFKVSKRRAFDRSIVSAAFLLTASDGVIEDIKIAFGGVAPLALRLPQTEAFLQGKPVNSAIWREAATVAYNEISPYSDAAASREHRTRLVANLLRKFGAEL